jgi:hypothetical protein
MDRLLIILRRDSQTSTALQILFNAYVDRETNLSSRRFRNLAIGKKAVGSSHQLQAMLTSGPAGAYWSNHAPIFEPVSERMKGRDEHYEGWTFRGAERFAKVVAKVPQSILSILEKINKFVMYAIFSDAHTIQDFELYPTIIAHAQLFQIFAESTQHRDFCSCYDGNDNPNQGNLSRLRNNGVLHGDDVNYIDVIDDNNSEDVIDFTNSEGEPLITFGQVG